MRFITWDILLTTIVIAVGAYALIADYHYGTRPPRTRIFLIVIFVAAATGLLLRLAKLWV